MPSELLSVASLQFRPLTPERWGDFERLFGAHGAHGGCWCMWWRLSRAHFRQQTAEENQRALQSIVDSGTAPGILAYAGEEAIGWCSVGPRESFPALERSRKLKLKRVDDRPVWSIVCFFVERRFRRQGLMLALLRAAVDYARQQGAHIVEAYPIAPRGGLSGYSGYTGVVSTFQRAGFVVVASPSAHQAVMRYACPL